MNRYTCTTYRDPDGFESYGEMVLDDTGVYIRYEDVLKKLEMFDEMLSALRETRKAMQLAGGDLTCARLDGIISRARALQEASK